MRLVKLFVLVFLVCAVSAIASAVPPPKTTTPTKAADANGNGDVLFTILKRLDSIEERLSRIEQVLASLQSPLISDDVERGMRFDAIERERRHLEGIELQFRPLKRR